MNLGFRRIQAMNDTIVTIFYKDGTKEDVECSDAIVRDGVLIAGKRNGTTQNFPLEAIKKYTIDRMQRW